MNEATAYIVKNIDQSYEIYNSILKMEESVLFEIDKAIRGLYSEWLGDQWEVYDDLNLKDNYWIGGSHNGVCYKDGDNEKESYIRIGFELYGEEPIWKLFGMPTENKSDYVAATLLLSNLKNLNNYPDLLQKIDKLIKTDLEKMGFLRKGGKSNPYYIMEIILSNTAILKGIENDDWDEALRPIKNSWLVLANLDWYGIINTIESYK